MGIDLIRITMSIVLSGNDEWHNIVFDLLAPFFPAAKGMVKQDASAKEKVFFQITLFSFPQ